MFNADSFVVGDETSVDAYPGCQSGQDVELWSLGLVGHGSLYFTPEFGSAIVDFLLNHPKP